MFNEEQIKQVWEKGGVVGGFDPFLVWVDPCGAWILRNGYGIASNRFGWVIDHIYPSSRGGDNNLLNLRPMQWENNASKGDEYPSYKASVQAEGNDNVKKSLQYTVNDDLQKKLKTLYNIK